MTEKPTVDSVAFILLDEDRFLVEERSTRKQVDPGKTCIPSGGIENGETPAEALVREMEEELRVTPSRFHFVATFLYPYQDVDFRVHYFVIWDWNGEINPVEAESVSWERQALADNVLDIWPDRLAMTAMHESGLHQS